MNQSNSRSPRHPSSTARILAWAEAEIADQNASLRDAVATSPELEALFAPNTTFELGTTKTAVARVALGRRA